MAPGDKDAKISNSEVSSEVVSSGAKPLGRLRPQPSARLLLGIGLVIILALLVKILFFSSTFKTLTYNNVQGHTFSIKFYRRHYISKDFTSTAPFDSHKVKPGYKHSVAGLASKVSENGKFPLWFSISEIGSSASYQKPSEVPCSTGTAFTVDYLKQRIPVCKLSLPEGRPGYTGTLIYKQKVYFIIITQVASKQQLDDKKSAVGLSDYQAAIKNIIASIKPIN